MTGVSIVLQFDPGFFFCIDWTNLLGPFKKFGEQPSSSPSYREDTSDSKGLRRVGIFKCPDAKGLRGPSRTDIRSSRVILCSYSS